MKFVILLALTTVFGKKKHANLGTLEHESDTSSRSARFNDRRGIDNPAFVQMSDRSMAPVCEDKWLGDGRCDKICAHIGNDNNDCSDALNTCAPGCFRMMIADEICNTECNNEACGYDAGDCDACALGCPNRLLGNEWCDPLCFNAACNFDNGDCEMEPFNWIESSTDECAPHCYFSMLNDGNCDDACLTKYCDFDGSDCGCSDECPIRFIADGYCDSKCRNSACLMDGGDCGDSLGETICNNGKCAASSLWDKECECDCDTADCLWDLGECEAGECMTCEDGYESHIVGTELACKEICGDGKILSTNYMACDSGVVDDDGCHECIVVDGYICTGEPSVCTKCNLGNQAVYPSDGSAAYCVEECGDGWILNKTDSDRCDDGNTNDEDGCSSDCLIEEDWSCIGEPSICGEYDNIDNFGNEDKDDENLGDLIRGLWDQFQDI